MRPGALLAAAALVPASAFAASGQEQSISLSAGPVAAWCGTATGLAFSLLPFLFLVSLVVEAFGKAPGTSRDFGAVVWRLVVVAVLLRFYPRVFGGLMGIAQEVADRVSNHGASWDSLVAASKAFLSARSAAQARELSNSSGVVDFAINLAALKADGLGGTLVDAALTVVFLVGQAATWIVSRLGTVLALLLYVLGPLALAGAVPRGSDVGTRWLRTFVSILCWPTISAMLVGLTAEYVLKGFDPHSSYEATYNVIGVAGLLCLTAFAVPTVASSLIGGSMHAISAGWASAAGLATAAVGGAAAAGAAVGSAAGAVGEAGGWARRLASAATSGGHAAPSGGEKPPPWARRGEGELASPVGGISPAHDISVKEGLARGEGRAALDSSAARPGDASGARPPPLGWSQGGMSPAHEKEAPSPVDFPTARPGRGRAGISPAASAASDAPEPIEPEPPTRPGGKS